MFNNPFLKNDSLFEAVRKAQAEGADRRQAEAQVNEEFGVYSRKAVIREQLAAYDARLAELVEAKKADKDYDGDGERETPKDEVWGSRLRAAKAAGKLKEEEQIDELSRTTLKSYVKKADRQANRIEDKVRAYKDKPGEEEKMYNRIAGANLARDKMKVRVAASEETDYSAQDRAPVTKSAPKEDPSTPKSYPGAASSLTAGNPTSQRMSNAKAAVSPIKEEQIDELKAPTAKTAHQAYDRAERSDDEMGDWSRSNRLYANLKKRYPGKSARNQKNTGKADLDAYNSHENHAKEYGGIKKSGALTKNSQKELKGKVKGRLGKHTAPHLPEEAMNEATYSAKAARAGKDIGKPGKMFSKIAAKAGEKYGSKERGEKVAGAILKNIRAKHVKEENLQELSAFGKAFAAAGGKNFTFGGKEYSGARADQKTSSVPTPPTKPAELKTSTTWKDPVSAGYDKPAVSSAPAPKVAPAPTMTTASPSTGAGVDTSVKSPTSGEKVNYAAPDVKAGQDKMKAMASLKESVQVGTSKYRIV